MSDTGESLVRVPAAVEDAAARELRPYPGLRPYGRDEDHLFFGRDDHTDALLERLEHARFVAVVGASGSGKSSLVRAGLIPALQRGYLRSGRGIWRVAVMSPGAAPLDALGRALAGIAPASKTAAFSDTTLQVALSQASDGLRLAAAAVLDSGEDSLLIVVDQFEEIFRVARPEDASVFVRLILAGAAQDDVRLYVVLTMRSEYIGRCAQFAGLPEALNDSQYLVPRLTRAQLKEAIEGPSAVSGGAIAPRLVQRLLNDTPDDPEQLPVLQHALMRMWDLGVQERSAGRAIDLDLYEDPRVGGLAQALDLHADEAFAELEPGLQGVARRVFQSLTDTDGEQGRIRRPCRFDRLAAVAGTDTSTVRRALAPFLQPDRRFVRIIGGDERREGPAQDDDVADISHESLIRLWRRLGGWVHAESKSAEMYRELVRAATKWRAERGSLYRGHELASAGAWWDGENPTEAWAQRYGGARDLAAAFLARSRNQQRLFRAAAAVLALILLALVAGLVVTWTRARALADESLARGLAAQAQLLNQGTTQGITGALLAIEALQRQPLPEAEDLVRRGLATDVLMGHRLNLAFDPADDYSATAASTAANAVALVTDDRWLRVLDLTSGRQRVAVRPGPVIESLTFTPDGSQLIVAYPREAVVLDSTTGERRQSAPRAPDLAIALDPSGRTLAVSAPDALTLLDLAGGTPPRRMGTSAPLAGLSFSGDGMRLVGGDRKAWRLLDVAALREIAVIPDMGPLASARVSRDAERIVLALGPTLHVHDGRGAALARLTLPVDIQGHWLASDQRTIVWHQPGRVMTLATDRLDAGRPLVDIAQADVRALVTDPNLVAVALDHAGDRVAWLTAATVASGAFLEADVSLQWAAGVHRLPGGELAWRESDTRRGLPQAIGAPAGTLVFAPSGDGLVMRVEGARTGWLSLHDVKGQRIADSGPHRLDAEPSTAPVFRADGSAVVWSPNARVMEVLEAGRAPVRWTSPAPAYIAAFDRNGRTVFNAGFHDAQFAHLKPGSDRTLELTHESTDGVSRAVLTDDGRRVVTVGFDASVHTIDATGARRVWSGLAVDTLAGLFPFSLVSADGRRVASETITGDVTMLDVSASGQRNPLDLRSLSRAALSPDGRVLAAPSGNAALVVDTDTRSTRTALDHGERVLRVAFSRGGRAVALAGASRVSVFDVDSGRQLRVETIANAQRVATSDDGSALAVAAADYLTLFFAGNRNRTWTDVGQLVEMTFTGSSRRLLVTNTSGVVRLLPNSATGEELRWTVSGVSATTFAADETLLAVGTPAGLAHVFDTTTGREVHRWSAGGYVLAMHLGRDITIVTTNAGTATVQRQPLAVDPLLQQACARMVRNPTMEEWRQYLGSTPYRITCPGRPE